MRRLEKKYKFKHVTIHGLRHTHATLLLEGGASIKEAQDRLGHKMLKLRSILIPM